MTKQANGDNLVPDPEIHRDKRKGRANKLGTFVGFSIITLVVGALGFGYAQLHKTNTALTQQVSMLQQKTGDDAMQLQSLVQSVQQLQQIQQANLRDNQDVTALYTQLNALNDQIDKLPLSPMPLQQEPDPMPVPAANEANMSWWQKGLNRTLQSLRQIVIVRYNASKTIPLVLPGERHYLYQNLHMEMQNAIWAVLHRNPIVFENSLARVATWVQQYFVQESPATINLIQALSTLRSVNIQPQDPQQAGVVQ